MNREIKEAPKAKTEDKKDFSKQEPKVASILRCNTLSHSGEGIHLFGHVQQSKNRGLCQDSVCMFSSELFSLAGVFDGFGPEGGLFSETIAENVIEICEKKKKQLFSKNDVIKILKAAVQTAIDNLQPPIAGGSTAAIGVLLPTNKYIIVSVGDSPSYILNKTSVNRLFDYNSVYTDFKSPLFSLEEAGLSPVNYASCRHILKDYINEEGIAGHALLGTEGFLEPGGSILLGSDGLTKNLLAVMNDKGRVIDVGGSWDLFSLIRDVNEPQKIAELIVSKIDLRISGAVRKCRDKAEIFEYSDGTVLMAQDDDFSLTMISRL